MTNQNKSNQMTKTLIDELGIADLPPEKQEQLLNKMTEVILKRIFLETMQRLNFPDQTTYEKMIEDNVTPEELETFLREKIPDYDDLVKKVVETFEGEMKGL